MTEAHFVMDNKVRPNWSNTSGQIRQVKYIDSMGSLFRLQDDQSSN